MNLNLEFELNLIIPIKNREDVIFFSHVIKVKDLPNSNFSKFKISNLKFDSNPRDQRWSLAQTSDFKP